MTLSSKMIHYTFMACNILSMRAEEHDLKTLFQSKKVSTFDKAHRFGTTFLFISSEIVHIASILKNDSTKKFDKITGWTNLANEISKLVAHKKTNSSLEKFNFVGIIVAIGLLAWKYS